MFELMLDNLIWDLAGLDGFTGACITAQFVAPHPRFRALNALCKNRNLPEHLIRRLNRLRGDTDSVYEKRSRADRIDSQAAAINPSRKMRGGRDSEISQMGVNFDRRDLCLGVHLGRLDRRSHSLCFVYR